MAPGLQEKQTDVQYITVKLQLLLAGVRVYQGLEIGEDTFSDRSFKEGCG